MTETTFPSSFDGLARLLTTIQSINSSDNFKLSSTYGGDLSRELNVVDLTWI
ncbi:hypothetical protein IAD21_01059 [Abditibacteriota bacterium]|nr:hypothetical protein IAD21_01059 [Abditibacteriota bacterium]